ncbi:unnamed protein product [Adineta ricciae]|uniref:Uncharacterized protein n=1 Tax=Adineta ricciae TaxID=249248 RepID=A0A813WZN0_ADIRI|nr:unnamed protein product [Adineta ricciae]
MTDSTVRNIATVFPISADALKPDPKFHRRRSIVREFSLNTSTHGIPGIARSESVHNRIFWTVCTIIFTGIMIYFITQSIIAYFGYPTQTSVSFVVQRTQPFPAVSFCNYAPIRFDKFIGPFINYTNSRNVTDTNDTSTITFTQSGYIRDFIQILFNSGQSVTQYLFTLDDMLLACIYNGGSCSKSDFSSFISPVHGYCYTFNAKSRSGNQTIRQTTQGGSSGVFQLRLYAHSNQYVPFVSDDVSVGIVIMVHDNDQLPLIDIEGIQLASGGRHKLSYKKRTNQLLPAPYSECTDKISLPMQALFDRYGDADYSYSQTICYSICTQTFIYHECNCVHPEKFTTRTIMRPDPCYSAAADRLVNTDSLWNQYCSDCSEACTSSDFTITPSSASTLSNEYAYIYKFAVENMSVPLPADWATSWINWMRKDYISVDIVTETNLVETYTQDPSIGPVDLISNIGGNTGLWIGISFLSLMELVEMLYRLLRYHCYFVRRRMRNSNNNNTRL